MPIEPIPEDGDAGWLLSFADLVTLLLTVFRAAVRLQPGPRRDGRTPNDAGLAEAARDHTGPCTAGHRAPYRSFRRAQGSGDAQTVRAPGPGARAKPFGSQTGAGTGCTNPASLRSDRWQLCRGLGGRLHVEWVADFSGIRTLESKEPPEMLWWLSLHGIYRMRTDTRGAALDLLPRPSSPVSPETLPTDDALLHPRYKVPAHCFAYVGDAGNPATWKLPYRTADGVPDAKRLPKAIQAILSNYRGTKVSSVPERDIPDVLVRLARAAMSLGRMPHQSGNAAAVYVQLEVVLQQLGRLDEVLGA